MLPFLQVQVLLVTMVQRLKQLQDFVEYFLAQLLFQQLAQLQFVVSIIVRVQNDGLDHKKSNLGKSLGTLIGFRALLGSVKMIAIYIFSNAGMAAGLKI